MFYIFKCSFVLSIKMSGVHVIIIIKVFQGMNYQEQQHKTNYTIHMIL